MADFKSEIVHVTVEPHPDADRLEVARVGGYTCVVGKGQFANGDLAAYVPEAAVVPDDVLETLGLTGRLAGKQKNRVKATRIRGILSQGLVHRADEGRLRGRELHEGDDVTETLGLTKYSPPVPTTLSGTVEPNPDMTMSYDVEAWKRFPDRIPVGTQVVVTEKIHGTFCGICYDPVSASTTVFSKGLGAKGLVMSDVPENNGNLYVRMMRYWRDNIELFHTKYVRRDERLFVLGEIFGRGVQDLHYDDLIGSFGDEKRFAVFDVVMNGKYRTWPDVELFCEQTGIPHVPVLHVGPWDPGCGLENGPTTIGGGVHMREGIVVRDAYEERGDDGERRILKLVSEDYLLRKGGTEFE